MCWIIWVFDLEKSWDIDLAKTSLDLLKWNKNRGQEWYGLSVLTHASEIRTYKFQDIYDENIYKELSGINDKIIWIIGHARYPTSGGNITEDKYMQPFSLQTRDRGFAFAFNWNIVNAQELAHEIEEDTSLRFQEPILDTSVLQEMIIREMNAWEHDTKRIQERIHNLIDGQCNMILMKENWSFTLAKDRWWFRPVSYNLDKQSGIFTFSSESQALFKIWVSPDDINHLNTGEAVQYNSKSKKISIWDMNLDVPNEKSRCFFETVYFADPKTILWKEPSTNHRFRLWQELAKNDAKLFHRRDSVVAHVPSSSKDSADGFADTLDITHLDGLINKVPDSGRTFIEWEWDRKKKIEEKYIFNPELKKYIEWKKLILIDDSIVRGSTLEFLVQKIFEYYKPSEIHIRIPSPPITGPCYYAINLKHPNELIVRDFFKDTNNPSNEEFHELAKHFWANSIRYVNKDEMISALRVNIKDMCLWCVTWDYPTPCGQKKFDSQLAEKK